MVKIRRNTWLRRRRLAQFGLKRTDRILDIGCGDGLDIQVLTSLGFKRVVGVDIAQGLLETAKARNPGVQFVLASAERLPLASGSFDVVLSDSVFCHVGGRKGVIEEIKRVLAPAGRLCFIESHQSWMRDVFDLLTFSPIAGVVPYLLRRRDAYIADHRAYTQWERWEKGFPEKLEIHGFQKLFYRQDFLSVIGAYRKGE